MSTTSNRQLIEDAFVAFSRGEFDFYRLLADDAEWTITGSSPIAGTYHGRNEFLEQVIYPLAARFAEPMRPTLQHVIAQDDNVVVVWEGHGTALDGEPYANRYCWILRIDEARITDVTAFFDAHALTSLWKRVVPRHP